MRYVVGDRHQTFLIVSRDDVRPVNPRYDFHLMEPGQSILVTADQATRRQVTNAAYHYGRRKKWKFKVKAVEGGTRCTRVR